MLFLTPGTSIRVMGSSNLTKTRCLIYTQLCIVRFGFHVGITTELSGRGAWSTGRNGVDKMSLASRESDSENGSEMSQRLKSENRAKVRI